MGIQGPDQSTGETRPAEASASSASQQAVSAAAQSSISSSASAAHGLTSAAGSTLDISAAIASAKAQLAQAPRTIAAQLLSSLETQPEEYKALSSWLENMQTHLDEGICNRAFAKAIELEDVQMIRLLINHVSQFSQSILRDQLMHLTSKRQTPFLTQFFYIAHEKNSFVTSDILNNAVKSQNLNSLDVILNILPREKTLKSILTEAFRKGAELVLSRYSGVVSDELFKECYLSSFTHNRASLQFALTRLSGDQDFIEKLLLCVDPDQIEVLIPVATEATLIAVMNHLLTISSQYLPKDANILCLLKNCPSFEPHYDRIFRISIDRKLPLVSRYLLDHQSSITQESIEHALIKSSDEATVRLILERTGTSSRAAATDRLSRDVIDQALSAAVTMGALPKIRLLDDYAHTNGFELADPTKKSLFIYSQRNDAMRDIKERLQQEAIARMEARINFNAKTFNKLLQELERYFQNRMIADILFDPSVHPCLTDLPETSNKDLIIVFAISKAYLSQLDPDLTTPFHSLIKSNQKKFKDSKNFNAMHRFLNLFQVHPSDTSEKKDYIKAIVRDVISKGKECIERMEVLSLRQELDPVSPVDLRQTSEALRDEVFISLIPGNLGQSSAAAAAASSSSSSSPDLRAKLKEAIIASPHPAALIHYLTTLQREGQLEPGKPGFELLQRIAMGNFQERRHTTCSHPAMTEAMRAQWEASAPDVQVAGQSLTAVDSEDWEDLLFCGTGISGSCLNCKGSFQQNAGLLGICLDGKIRMGTVKNANGVIIARCIMRLTTDQAGNTCLFKESIYPAKFRNPAREDAYEFQIAQALDTLVQRKADAMGVALYTYASDAAAATSGVELSTPPNIAGFDYSDVNPGKASASFTFSSVHRLYSPG
jgi:hypothetical protein